LIALCLRAAARLVIVIVIVVVVVIVAVAVDEKRGRGRGRKGAMTFAHNRGDDRERNPIPPSC
jgi:hypothetical protein